MPPIDTTVERTAFETVPPIVDRTSSPSSYLPAFHSLTSPVLDLASTLTINRAGDDVDAQNVAFLRNTFEAADGMANTRPEYRTSGERRTRGGVPRLRSPSEEARERLYYEHRLEELRQRQESLQAWSDRTIHRTRPSYGEGLPSHQSMFDWAPARDDEEEEVEVILGDLTRQQPNIHPEILRVLAQARVDSNREARNRPTSRPQLAAQGTSTHESHTSLRSAAILQSFRRNHRILTRSREYLNRLATPEREGANAQERAPARDTSRRDQSDPNRRHRGPPFNSTYTTAGDPGRYEMNRLAWQASQPMPEFRSVHGESVEALRRRYLENPAGSSKNSEFERIIKYLHGSRTSDDESPGTSDQLKGLQAPEKPHSWDNADCIREQAKCPPPPTSWLSSGSLFVGTQQATPIPSSSATMHRLVQSQPRSATLDPTLNRAATFDASIPPWLRHLTTSELLSLYSSPNPPSQDQWTVKVAIHNVDYETMTLQGTMEAFNIPSTTTSSEATSTPPVSNPARNTNPTTTTFSTYLEGELIDFTTHTLLTEPDTFGVKTTPDIDAAYWRRLEPFAALTDEEIARALLDRQWIEEQLMGQYVLMRWKERCFVKPTLTSAVSSPPPTSPPRHHQHMQPPATSPHATAANTVPIGPRRNSTMSRPIPAQLPANRNSSTSFLSGPDGNGYGLSISGFYYVSLRRSDGRLEGLYCDPQSNPYQHLEMKPRSGGWGTAAWKFR